MTEKERENSMQKGRKPRAVLTFDEIKASPKEMLTVTDVEKVLGLRHKIYGVFGRRLFLLLLRRGNV